MKKIDFLETIRIDLTAGGVTSENNDKYDYRYLAARVNNLFNQALFEIYATQKNKPGGMKVFDSLSKAYPDVAVTKDVQRNEYYSELPAGLASIPQNYAIRKVRPVTDTKGDLVQIDSVMLSTLSNLPVYGLMDVRLYYLEGNKIFYPKHDGFEKVLMSLVIPFIEYDDDDDVPMPVMFQNTLYARVVNELKGTFPIKQDLKNDNKIEP